MKGGLSHRSWLDSLPPSSRCVFLSLTSCGHIFFPRMRAKFVAPQIQDNPTGWGPCDVPDQFRDMPYQPFSKGDRLGKVSGETSCSFLPHCPLSLIIFILGFGFTYPYPYSYCRYICIPSLGICNFLPSFLFLLNGCCVWLSYVSVAIELACIGILT